MAFASLLLLESIMNAITYEYVWLKFSCLLFPQHHTDNAMVLDMARGPGLSSN